MSWFSDFAKTALNEAQKRIDKVLYIEEDETSKNESSNSKLFSLFFSACFVEFARSFKTLLLYFLFHFSFALVRF